MTTVTTKAMAKVAAVATGLAMATSMLSLAPMAHAAALSSTQVSAIIALLSSFGADASTIANVQASLTGGTPSSTGSTSTSSSCSFTKDLTNGSTGAEVTCLQQALIAGGYSIPAGATGYFGGQTVSAVMAWQKAAGVSPVAGYFGAKSRAAFNLGGSSSSTGSTGTTGTTVTGNGLKVALAATSPNGSVLVQGQAIGDLADFVFSNPTSAPINVTAISLKRIGVSNDSTMANVYLYNNGTRITDSAGVSSSAFSYSDANGIFTVPAGGTYTVSVRSDIAGSTSGQQIGVSLVSVSSNGTLDSSVSFPVNSGYQTISAASLAAVDYNGTVATPSATSISPQNDFPIWQDNISVSTNAVKLAAIKFTNLGSIDSALVTNLRLYVDGVMVGSAIPTMSADRTVTFDLTAAPAALSTQSHVVKVLANITGGASRTIQLSVQRSSDAMFVDSQLNQPVTPTYNSGSTFASMSAGIITISSVTATTGVSVSRAPSSPSANVAVGASSVKWASFTMLASGENVKVSDLNVYSANSVHVGGGLKNGKVYVNGTQVGSTKDIGSVGTPTDFSLGSSLILPAGQSVTVDVYADAKTSTSTNLSNGETVTVSLAAGSSNAQGQSSLSATNVPAAITSGLAVPVSSSSLTATKYTGYGNQTMIAGAQNAKIGAFTLSTGSTEGVTVNTINFSLTAGNAASVTNLTIKDEATGTTLGSVITTPSTSNSYAINLDIPASSSKTIGIYANILSSVPNGTIVATVTTSTAGTGDTTGAAAQAASTPLQTITIAGGTLSVTNGAGDPVSNNVLAGVSSVQVGQFNFAAANSAYTINNLAILVPNAAVGAVTNVTVKGKDAAGNVVSRTSTLNSTGVAYATATFTGLGMYVPANDSANLDVYVGTPTIASGGTTNIAGSAIRVTLDAGATTGTLAYSDAAGTVSTSINSGTNIAANGTFYLRKSIPTIAMVASGATVPATGSPLYKFSITADPAGAVEWTQIAFNISTSSATVTNVYLTDDSTGTSLLDTTGANQFASTSSAVSTTTLLSNSSASKYAQVAAGATKVYDLYGTVTGYTTGSSITIGLAADSSNAALAAAVTNLGNKMVWSDRSASSHSTTSLDWTSGYLLKNFTSSAITYSK